MKASVAKILLDVKAVTLNMKTPYTYTSGIRSPIYCDNRLLISHPTYREQIVNFFLQKIQEQNISCDVLAGTATAGIPWAALLAEKLKKPMIYIRAGKKEHGKENKIEGVLEKGQKVLVIEDLISTGGSSVSAVDAAKENGGEVQACVAIFTYEMEKARQRFAEAQCPLFTLSDFSTLIGVAGDEGQVTAEESAKVLEWNKDPPSWGKKMGLE